MTWPCESASVCCGQYVRETVTPWFAGQVFDGVNMCPGGYVKLTVYTCDGAGVGAGMTAERIGVCGGGGGGGQVNEAAYV